jgi:hypothetical protein
MVAGYHSDAENKKTVRTEGNTCGAACHQRTCALRAPTASKFSGYTPSGKFERGFWVNRMRERYGDRFRDANDGLPPDRRLCTDGFIFRAQSAIRADGFRPRRTAMPQ